MLRLLSVLALATVAAAPLAAPAFGQTAPGSAQVPALAEPLWPIALRLPNELVAERVTKQANRPADVLAWVPPGAKHLRAVMLCPENTDSKHFHEYEPLRKVASKHEVGIVYMRSFSPGVEYSRSKPLETPPAAPGNVPKLLEILAGETGIPEFKHASWITFGKSSRGEFPFRMAWVYPERTIAGITYHGETPTWPMPKWAKPQDKDTILYVSANGQEEWDGTWYRHTRPGLLNYRANTAWLPHQAVAFGVGHGNYTDAHGSPGWGKPVPEGKFSVLRTWDYLTLFADKALTLRLPEKGYPTDKPFELRQVDPAKGYLVHPRAIETLLGSKWMALRQKNGEYQEIPWPQEKHPVLDTEQGPLDPKLLIRKYNDVPEAERKSLLWIADRELAEAWVRLYNFSGQPITVP